MGFEDEIPDTEDAVKAANAYAENKRNEAEAARVQTLAKMQENQDELRKKQEQLSQLSELLGVSEMRHKIDQQDQSITYLAGRMDEMIKTLNNFVASSQTEAAPMPASVTTAGIPGMDKLALLQQVAPNLIDKLMDRLFPSQQAAAAAPLISQEVINEKMTKAFFDDLETGESIRQFISDTLKKKATQQIVKQSLGNIGVPSHEPE